MTENMKHEIIKSHVYGMPDRNIAELYGVTENDVKMLICEHHDEIEAERKYRQLLEGGKPDV